MVRRGDPVDTRPLFDYTTAGGDGGCGHRHRSETAAVTCLERYRRSARAAGLVPTRTVRLISPRDDLPGDEVVGAGRTLQERILDETGDPFWVLAASVLTWRSRIGSTEEAIYEILDRYPTPDALRLAGSTLESILQPSGLAKQNAATLRGLAAKWLRSGFPEKDPEARRASLPVLPGVGLYVIDSWALFVDRDLDRTPRDPVLRARRERLRTEEPT